MYFREICGRIRSSKFCEFCVFCVRMLLRRGLAEGAVLARLVQLLLGWCTSCSGKRQSRAETSAPPKCATVSVRRPIGFRSPSDRFAFAVQSDSVRRPIGFRPPSVEKCWEKCCKNVVLNGNTIGDFAIFDVSVFRCFYYPHPNNLCISVKSVGEYSAVNSVSSAYSVGKNSAVNFVHSAYSVGEYSAVNSVSSAYSVGEYSAVNSVYFCEICGRILSNKFCEFCVFCGRPFRQPFDEIVLFCPISLAFRKKTPYKFGKIKLFSLSLPISLEIVIKQLQFNTHYIY